MPSFDFSLATDENGYFQHSSRFNPRGPFSVKVELSVTLKQPADTLALGRLDIDPADGGRGNQARDFAVESGDTTSLGSWRLDGGDNVIVLTGRTEPMRANSNLQATIDAHL